MSLLPILMLLIEVEAQADNADEAQRLRKQARDVVEFLAESIDIPDLHDKFLAQSHIRELLETAG